MSKKNRIRKKQAAKKKAAKKRSVKKEDLTLDFKSMKAQEILRRQGVKRILRGTEHDKRLAMCNYHMAKNFELLRTRGIFVSELMELLDGCKYHNFSDVPDEIIFYDAPFTTTIYSLFTKADLKYFAIVADDEDRNNLYAIQVYKDQSAFVLDLQTAEDFYKMAEMYKNKLKDLELEGDQEPMIKMP